MNVRWLSGRTFGVLAAAPLVLAAVLTGMPPGGASASTCVGWTGVQPPNPSSSVNVFSGVAALSSCNAWAAGYYDNGTADQTLIEHWNGTAWSQEPSPNPGGSANDNVLGGVAATSSSNAWAVGHYCTFSCATPPSALDQTLIERWHGTAWSRVPSPNPGGSVNDNVLSGVAATSSSNAWAVGWYERSGTPPQTLIEHWNGTAWRQVSSPNPGGSGHLNLLDGVAATSSSNAWAVGYYDIGATPQTLIEHWNGTAWRQVSSPNPGGSANDNFLYGVAATSPANIWAVGSYFNGTATETLALHCC